MSELEARVGNAGAEEGHADRVPVGLTVAGSDSGGGAGIQADLKTFHAFGVFGTSAVTAITVQNTRGVFDVLKVDPAIVAAQIEAVCEDLRPDACKTGMLADDPIIRRVAATLDACGDAPVVVDPVMVATSGDRLLEEEAVTALCDALIPRATVVTPNLPEAEILAGMRIGGPDEMRRAAERIRALGCQAVLLKGGHLDADEVLDILYDGREWHEWRATRLDTTSTHGTGCTVSAALASGLARGLDVRSATDVALGFTRRALQTAPYLGEGNGPLNHWAEVLVPDQPER
jgi:hydroxymethylpyrimidine/phosphomethylpyrimidine kinase